jgi:hypothetical protein
MPLEKMRVADIFRHPMNSFYPRMYLLEEPKVETLVEEIPVSIY